VGPLSVPFLLDVPRVPSPAAAARHINQHLCTQNRANSVVVVVVRVWHIHQNILSLSLPTVIPWSDFEFCDGRQTTQLFESKANTLQKSGLHPTTDGIVGLSQTMSLMG